MIVIMSPCIVPKQNKIDNEIIKTKPELNKPSCLGCFITGLFIIICSLTVYFVYNCVLNTLTP